MTVPFPQPPPNDRAAAGRTTQARDARRERTRKWLDYEQLVDNDLRDASCSKLERVKLIAAQDTVAERLRILSGAVKPGSRNVSVRELAPGESTKRLPKSRGSASDYLADAARVLAEAERASQPISNETAAASAVRPPSTTPND